MLYNSSYSIHKIEWIVDYIYCNILDLKRYWFLLRQEGLHQNLIYDGDWKSAPCRLVHWRLKHQQHPFDRRISQHIWMILTRDSQGDKRVYSVAPATGHPPASVRSAARCDRTAPCEAGSDRSSGSHSPEVPACRDPGLPRACGKTALNASKSWPALCFLPPHRGHQLNLMAATLV